MAVQWDINGGYFETCNCDSVCPCAFLNPPTKGECTLLAGWHIAQGYYGDLSLNGLNVVLAAYSPGHMMEVPWKAALYLDETASEAQKNALTEIFTGKAGGHPAKLAAHIGEFVGVKSVPIEYHSNGKERGLTIPNIADAEIKDFIGDNNESVTVTARPWSIVPKTGTVLAKSERMSFDDYDFHWKLSGEHGAHADFDYNGAS